MENDCVSGIRNARTDSADAVDGVEVSGSIMGQPSYLNH